MLKTRNHSIFHPFISYRFVRVGAVAAIALATRSLGPLRAVYALRALRALRAIRPLRAIRALRAIRPLRTITTLTAITAIGPITAIGSRSSLSHTRFLADHVAFFIDDLLGPDTRLGAVRVPNPTSLTNPGITGDGVHMRIDPISGASPVVVARTVLIA
ncbi:MAG: hypothetical protein JRG90_22430 [Deltaproteobacteria bacterium]|nr:hypothetical protein [Deltaproteobacteria bacterium]MBW2666408.1 hypothetical protein [Deltaproteobacteria bacterium]